MKIRGTNLLIPYGYQSFNLILGVNIDHISVIRLAHDLYRLRRIIQPVRLTDLDRTSGLNCLYLIIS